MSLPTPTTAPSRCRCCCCCCCGVPELSMCPSITGFPYRYVGVFDVADMKKTTEKNRVGFSVSVFLDNRKTDFKQSVFCCEKSNKNDRKKRLSVFGSQRWSYAPVLHCPKKTFVSNQIDNWSHRFLSIFPVDIPYKKEERFPTLAKVFLYTGR